MFGEEVIHCEEVTGRLVRSDPSTGGNLAAAVSCTILLAVVPTSTARVPLLEIGPPVKPLPALTCVTVPEVTGVGSHCELKLFQPRTWPTPGALAATVRVPILEA